MKNFFLRKSAFAGLLLGTVALASCEKFLDANNNPNTPESIDYTLTLPNALNRPLVSVGSNLNILGNLWTGNWAQASDYLFYVPQQQYNLTPASYDGVWQNLYAGSLADLRYMELQAQTAGNKNYVAIAKIMQAYNFQILTDGWGDIPFTDILSADPRIPLTNLTPKYDPSQTVYEGIIKLLDDGIGQIDDTAIKPSANDIYFGGNMSRWRRFANTLKLRVYMRQSRARSSYAQAGIQAMQAAGAQFLGVDENVAGNPGYTNTLLKTNPLNADIGFGPTGGETSGYRATRANVFAVNYLKQSGDTLRLKALYAPRVNTTNIARNFYGAASGISSSYAPGASGQVSPLGPKILDVLTGPLNPVYLMTSAESFFLRAEAVERGYLTGNAKTLYQSGVEQSFTLLGYTSAQAAAYYNSSVTNPTPANYYGISATATLNSTPGRLDLKIVSPKYDDATTTEKRIEAIITQKWIANNGFNGYESWNEFRRTGYPSGNYISLSARQRAFPVRLPYPQSEVNNNPNTPASGVTLFTPRLFWDID
jgi:hypothetical protein